MSDSKISLDTIARIFQEKSFKPDTKISNRTLQLTREYIHLFINEAIIRSNEQRLADGDGVTKVDGIDNVAAQSQLTQNDEISADELEDMDDPIDTHESNTQRQLSNAFEDTANDTLDSRHLSKIAGMLVMDF